MERGESDLAGTCENENAIVDASFQRINTTTDRSLVHGNPIFGFTKRRCPRDDGWLPANSTIKRLPRVRKRGRYVANMENGANVGACKPDERRYPKRSFFVVIIPAIASKSGVFFCIRFICARYTGRLDKRNAGLKKRTDVIPVSP